MNTPEFLGKDSPDEEIVIGEGPITRQDTGEEVGYGKLVGIRSSVNDAAKNAAKVGYNQSYAANFDSVFGQN